MGYNVWIVDDDISFAVRLKELILASPVTSAPQKKIELFHRPGHFLARLKEVAREAAKKPHLVFLDIQMPDQDGLEVYCTLLTEENPVTSVIHFCSSMSYGLVSDFFAQKGQSPPPFIQKRDVAGRLESILARYAPEGEFSPAPVLFAERRKQTALSDLLKRLKNHYYGEPGGEEPVASLLESFKAGADQLGLKDLSEAAKEALLQEKQGSPGRKRRGLKDLLTLGDKMLKSAIK
ncbi:MAG: response regulator [Deltaproteobacteria bacterium]|nr:response regulator [Deltaproteobacteria bacterium]